MIDILTDSLIDLLRLLPFLYLTFLIIELLESRFSQKSEQLILKSKQHGPLVGSLLGIVPECGFSVMAANLYISKIITFGTLIAIMLSTSDEMLPILLSHQVEPLLIIKILLTKIVSGILAGYLIDMLFKSKNSERPNNTICQQEDCHCEENGPFKAALVHTASTSVYIFIFNLIISLAIHFIGQDSITALFSADSVCSILLAGLIGLIPNCVSSILLTEAFLNGIISYASLLAGLLTNSGLAMLVLFKNNRNRKENLLILILVYFTGIIVGLIHLL